MAIRTSSARDVDALVEQLHSQSPRERDTAIARLRIIGARAHTRLLALLSAPDTPADVRAATLRIVDATDGARVLRAVLAATLDDTPVVAVAALQAIRQALVASDDTATLEAVSAIAADPARPLPVRQAAVDALSELPDEVTRPLIERIAPQLSPTPPLDDPAAAADWLRDHQEAPPGVLHDLLSHARERERDGANASVSQAWLTLRAAVHTTLAERGSRVAVYDLKEAFERAVEPLPIGLLVAMRTLGDLTCLDALARAWDATAGDAWWRSQLQDVATAIAVREKATGRTAAMKRLRARWPGFLP